MKSFNLLFTLLLGLAFGILGTYAYNNYNASQQESAETLHSEIQIAKSFKSVGQQIKDARLTKGISQEDLALSVDLSEANIKNIEEDAAIPMRDVLVDIERQLGCEIVLDPL